MEALPYLLKVNICWAVFYGLYWMLFRRHTFFFLNRCYLLFSLLISFAIPAIEFQETIRVVESAPTVITTSDLTFVASVKPDTYPIQHLMLSLYAAGIVLMLSTLGKSLLRIYHVIRKGICIPMQDYQLVISHSLNSTCGSFSFLNWMIISNEDYEQNFEPIFMHEMVHIRQWHTLDILLIELLKVIFWFNPILWLYKRALQDTHEYLADEQASDRDLYAAFLLSYAKSALATSVANRFFNSSLLKKRIHMIYQDRTARWLRTKYLLFLPVLVLAVTLMAARKYVYDTKDVDPKKVETQKLVIVKGLVSDNSGLPIANAAVTFSGSDASTVTTTNGHFEIRGVPKGSVMTISHNDFLPHMLKVRKLVNDYQIRLKSSKESVLAKKNKPSVNQSTSDKDAALRLLLDRWPGLPDGNKFIANTLKYPKQAKLDGIQGQVSISFLVDTEGNISDPKIEKGVRKDLDNEAMRVVRLMPKWRPAQKNFKPVAVRYTMNIAFNIEVDQLPLAVKETTKGFWGDRSIYSPAKTAPIGNTNLKELFESTTIDLSDSIPPRTTLHGFGYGYVVGRPAGKPLDMKIKLPKK